VLKKAGKEYRVPLEKLSEEDQEFLENRGAEETAPSEGSWSILGKEIKPGEDVEAVGDLDDKVARALSGNKLKPSQVKIRVRLPSDFDPAKPQKVFWAVGGINNEEERLRGNIATFSRGNTPYAKGWIIVSADTEHGNPRESTVKQCKGDKEFHLFVIEELTKVWPEFKNWKHACGGHSSGAKGSYFRIAQLLKAKANVVGGFFSGCNQSMAQMAGDETGVRKSGFKKVKAFQSTGDKDGLVDASKIERVSSGMKSAGIRQIRSKTFPGAHVMSQEQLGEAMDWFAEE